MSFSTKLTGRITQFGSVETVIHWRLSSSKTPRRQTSNEDFARMYLLFGNGGLGRLVSGVRERDGKYAIYEASTREKFGCDPYYTGMCRWLGFGFQSDISGFQDQYNWRVCASTGYYSVISWIFGRVLFSRVACARGRQITSAAKIHT